MEIKIEIKKWFKLGFLDKIIKQIAFFDFCHFCEICETRVAHLIHFEAIETLFIESDLKYLENSVYLNHALFVLNS